MPDLQLGQRDAQLVELATVYHLGRPGSEIDPVTRQPHDLGLGPVREVLANNPGHAQVTLALTEYQLHLLGEALLGTLNELKQMELSERRSAVPGFAAALARLFPEAAEDQAGTALELAGEVMMLRRRLDTAVREADTAIERARARQAAEPPAERRPWWKRWG